MNWLLLIVFASVAANENFLNCPNSYSDVSKMNITFDCANLEEDVVHSDFFDQNVEDNSCTYMTDFDAYYDQYREAYKSFTEAYQITFENCRFPYLPHTFFQRINKIFRINLEHSGVEAITYGKFADGSNLETLLMSFNELMELPGFLFSHTPQIQEIDFSHNRIRKIDENTFRGAAKKIKKINLAHNNINAIDRLLFSGLLELEDLDISHNIIEHFDADLSSLTQLEFLRLDNNKIMQLGCNVFANQLEIDLSVNELKEIDWNCNSTSTLTLKIENNLLGNLTLPASTLVTSLSTVLASRNKIENISIEGDLPNLRLLNLGNNNLKNISAVSEHCVALANLDLSFNDIRHVDANAFVKMTKLQYLYLNNMNLTEVGHGTFSHQRSLIELNLSHNKLKQINFDLFVPYVENLTELHLNDNNLTNLDGWTNSLFPKLSILAVSNNDFNCSYLAQFLRQFKYPTIRLVPSSTLIMHTAEQKSIHGISCIDTQRNPIEKSIIFDDVTNDSMEDREAQPADVGSDNDHFSPRVSKLLSKLSQENYSVQLERVESILSSIKFLLIFLCIIIAAFVVTASFVKVFKPMTHHRLYRNERNTIYLQENDVHHSSTTLNTLVPK